MSDKPIVVPASESPGDNSTPTTFPANTPGGQVSRGYGRLILALGILVAVFSRPLYDLTRLALKSELYSHVLLIPFVSLYLIWISKPKWANDSSPPLRKLAFLPMGAAMLSLTWFCFHLGEKAALTRTDYLASMMVAFVCFLLAACCLFLGRRTLRVLSFPLLFLFFIVPFPTMVENGIEIFFQHTSAAASSLLLTLTGMPVLRNDLSFQLPGFRLTVGQECSGIRSSLVLFITSLIAGQLLLRSPWKKAVFVLAVIPLGILRNAIRIWTIAQLCVRVGPEMIDSWIHRRGGPFFFLLSLIPFFLLLFFLRKSELVNVSKPANKS